LQDEEVSLQREGGTGEVKKKKPWPEKAAILTRRKLR
jgi:hypothetical protein